MNSLPFPFFEPGVFLLIFFTLFMVVLFAEVDAVVAADEEAKVFVKAEEDSRKPSLPLLNPATNDFSDKIPFLAQSPTSI